MNLEVLYTLSFIVFYYITIMHQIFNHLAHFRVNSGGNLKGWVHLAIAEDLRYTTCFLL